MTTNPLVSIVLGITLFGDILARRRALDQSRNPALAVLVTGVVILTRSPLVAGAPEGHVDDEKLGGARRRAMTIPPIEALP